jgi:hypothetical protein
MSSLIAAIDSSVEESKNMKLGENGHCEYAWSTDIQEKIVQLSFQLVRSDESHMNALRIQLDCLLKTLSDQPDDKESQFYKSVMFRMLAQTRDIVSGKGEYALSYMMLFSWYTYFPDLALYAVETFVTPEEESGQPYGSWKDMKYIASYCKDKTNNTDHQIIRKCVNLVNAQLKMDLSCQEDVSKISLCAKWVPREGSKYSWLFKLLAHDYYKNSVYMVQNRCYREYRKLVSGLNKKIDTVQIKQCGNVWATIDHNKTTSITLSRNKKAFLNVKKDGRERSDSYDRIICAEKFKRYVESRIKSGKEVKGANVGLDDFTRQAFDIIAQHDRNQLEADLLNSQWRSNSSKNGGLNKMIAMVDTSSSMYGGPLEAAIALGIRVADKSILGKRVLTFDAKPTWHNLEDKDDFVSMVESLKEAPWGGNTNLYAAFMLILESLTQKGIPPEETEGLVFAIFSDMQIDQADRTFSQKSLIGTIKKMYELAGYKCPHILFWNLRGTSGFPCLSSENGASMMSGFSPSLLNLFCEKGAEALETATPWNMLIESLNNERYNQMECRIFNHLMV